MQYNEGETPSGFYTHKMTKTKNYLIIEIDKKNYKIRGQFSLKNKESKLFKTKNIIIGQALETCHVGEMVMIRI
jgi:hypothetical protein